MSVVEETAETGIPSLQYDGFPLYDLPLEEPLGMIENEPPG